MVDYRDLQSLETAIQHGRTARSHAGQTSYASGSGKYSDLGSAESTGTLPSSGGAGYAPSRSQVFLRGAKRRSSVFAIVIVLLLGGGAVTLPALPIVGLHQILEAFDLDFDYTREAGTRRAARITDDKFKNANVDCKGVKGCEQITSLSDREAKTYQDAGITIEREPLAGANNQGRGRIIKMEYIDPFTNIRSIATNGAELNQARINNPGFARAIDTSVHNMAFNLNDDSKARAELRKNGASKADSLEGSNEEEMRKSFERQVSGERASGLGSNLRPVTDEEGNRTGYTDENGTLYSEQEATDIRESSRQIQAGQEIGSRGVLKSFATGAVRSVNVIGTLSTVCEINSIRKAIIVANELVKKRQLIKFAWTIAPIIGKLKAVNNGIDIDTGDLHIKAEMLGNAVTEIIDTNPTIVDPNSDPDNPRTIPNERYNRTGHDSEILAIVLHGSTKPLSAGAQRFAFDDGMGGSEFAKFNKSIDTYLGGREKQICRFATNPIIELGGAAIGLAAGGASGGTLTAAMAAVNASTSVALQFAKPYLIASLADIMSGNLVKDLRGVDFVDAMGSGMQARNVNLARSSGLMPASVKEVVQYQTSTKQTLATYARYEAEKAKDAPFDIYNQYSFLGSFARSIIPYTQTSSAFGSTLLSMSGLFSAASSTIAKKAYAADYVSEARFSQCNLQKYREFGLAADLTCLPPLVMSPEAMNMKASEVQIRMEETGNIEKGTYPGTPRDNGQPWNYKKFDEICLKGDPEDPDLWLSECTKPERKELTDLFAAYTLDTRVEEAHSATPQAQTQASSSNRMSSSGWVFPTVADADISSGFGPRLGGDHKGIDFSMKAGGDATLNKPIYAVRGGKVIATGPMNGYGNWIVIDHGNKLYSLYAHMWDDGVMVEVGQDVRAGDQIGKIGNKGESTGPHLHLEIWEGTSPTAPKYNEGGPVDPTAAMREAHEAAKSGNRPTSENPNA